MIEFEGVTKRFRIAPRLGRNARIVEALRAVNLSIDRGAVVGVVGPNGAGKTTMFALLLGFLEPTAGTIAIDGAEPRRYVRRNGVAYLPERFKLPREWSVRSALAGLIGLDGVPDGRNAVTAVLEKFELQEHADKPVGALSRGLLQRVGLAQALLPGRALVVLDEPAEGLDPIWRLRFRELIAEQRARGHTVLIASHELAEIERLADRAILLDDGAVKDVLELRSLAAAPQRYRILLQEAHAAVSQAFPAAEQSGSAPSYLVDVADARDLTTRLAALIEAGAVVLSVTPAAGLEERVARSLQAGRT